MNKEEIIDYLKSYAQPPQMMKVFPDFEIIKEAVSMLEQQDSLPKNLETAALRYAIPAYMKDVDENYLHEYPRDPIKEEAFIAGAEWQKGQKPELVRHPPITYTYNSNASRDERLQAALLALLGSDLIQVKDGGYFTKQDLIGWVKKKPVELSEEDIKTILDISFWNDDPEKILNEYHRLKK